MLEPTVNTAASPNIDARGSDLEGAWRLDQMRREVVRSRELIAELRRQIGSRNAEIRNLKAELAARASDRSWMSALIRPRIHQIRSSNPFGRLRVSLSWIAHRASLRISRGANAR
jgi:uncharacterized small protein (DUF1192 family)